MEKTGERYLLTDCPAAKLATVLLNYFFIFQKNVTIMMELRDFVQVPTLFQWERSSNISMSYPLKKNLT